MNIPDQVLTQEEVRKMPGYQPLSP
jgi:hypothetical protein